MNQSIIYELTGIMPAVVETGLMSKTCTFYKRPESGAEPITDDLGQVDLENSEYTAVAGLIGIQCMLSVINPMLPPPDATNRMATHYEVKNERHLLLDDNYPTVEEQFIVAVTDSVGTILYEVMSVEPDSQNQMTRLAVRTWEY